MNGEIDLELYTISIIGLNNALENPENDDSFKEIVENFQELYEDIINDLNQDEIQFNDYYLFFENGKNVFPEEIENYIMGIEYVQEVVVRGIKNEQGEEVALLAEAFLNKDKVEELKIADEEKAERLKKDILNACKELPLYKKISKVEIRENEFKKTTTNKSTEQKQQIILRKCIIFTPFAIKFLIKKLHNII